MPLSLYIPIHLDSIIFSITLYIFFLSVLLIIYCHATYSIVHPKNTNFSLHSTLFFNCMNCLNSSQSHIHVSHIISSWNWPVCTTVLKFQETIPAKVQSDRGKTTDDWEISGIHPELLSNKPPNTHLLV